MLMKLIKKTVFFLSFLALTGTFIGFILTFLMKPETVKDYVSSQLTALTGEKTEIRGQVHWQFFPTPGIKINHIEIASKDKNPASFSLNTLLFKVKIAPLFTGKLVITDVTVDGFTITVDMDKATTVSEHTLPLQLASHQEPPLEIKHLLLTHGLVELHSHEKVLVFKNVQIGAENPNIKQALFPLQVKASVQFFSEKKLVAKSSLQFAGSTTLTPEIFYSFKKELLSYQWRGQLAMKNTTFPPLKIHSIAGHIDMQKGLLQIAPITLSLYQGESMGDIRYNLTNRTLQINQTATGLQVEPLIQSLFNSNKLSGNLDFSLHTETHFDKGPWPRNTQGNGMVSMGEGNIAFVDISKIIIGVGEKIGAMIQGNLDIHQPHVLENLKSLPSPAGNTPFRFFTFRYALKEGQVFTDSLVLQTALLLLKGIGALNLKNYYLDTEVSLTLLSPPEEIAKIQQLLGGSFALSIAGPLEHPQVLPNIKKIYPVLTKLWLEEQIAKPVNQMKKAFAASFTPTTSS